ncbi:hypothetical protein MPSEU_000464600 [Mayamaea pseudoterrestris]|nr:hypothetical protein MPSEU_000464600 [Mayamaea pseudoterrestris]
MCNSAESGLGPAANQWMQQQQGCSLLARRESELDLPVFITSQFSEDQANEKLVEEKIAEEEDVAELGEGIYVRSGDAVNLREVVLNQEMDDPSDFITYAAECVVLQDASSSSSPATITIVKIAKARSKAVGSPLIKKWRYCHIQTALPGRHDGKSKSNGNETRYLTVHKGWWLKWSHLSKSAYFVVQTCDDFGAQDGDEMRSKDTQSSLCPFGGTFRIVSKKWPKYQVGIAPTGSARYGGKCSSSINLQGLCVLSLTSCYYRTTARSVFASCETTYDQTVVMIEEEYLGDDLPLGRVDGCGHCYFRASGPIPTLPAVARGTAELLAKDRHATTPG